MVDSQMKEILNNFFKDYALYIAIGVAALILLAILIIVLANRKRARGDKKEVLVVEASDWQEALGGKDNILEITAIGSRLTLKLSDSSKIDEDKIKQLGVSNIMKMSNKVTLVVENQAESILRQLQ